MSVAIIPDFVKYQIEWLTSHDDLEFEPAIKDAIVQMLKDTGKSFIDEQAVETSQIDHIAESGRMVERTAETAQKEACPVCGYKFQDCQCRFSGSAHPDRSKRARVVADHIYLLTDAQIAHLAKVQEWWQISYDDEEMNRILEELKGNEKD